MNLEVKDCSPFIVKLSSDDKAWLARLAGASRHSDLVMRLEEGREDEPIVACDPDGTWRAGRYVGSLTFEGRRLNIRPRFGEDTLRAWCTGAFNIALIEMPGGSKQSDWFIPWLIANIWARSLVAAAKHGLPALRTDRCESGPAIRGRLDIGRTVRMRAAGNPGAASSTRHKSLDNAISCAIVAAYNELSEWLGKHRNSEWLPDRAKDLVTHLLGAVGSRVEIPTLQEIQRVRLTPITTNFRSLAELSVRIARQRGITGDTPNKEPCKGVLLDVAELWELYVLAALKRAWPSMEIIHGARSNSTERLLFNDHGDQMNKLIPDFLVKKYGETRAVIDAKYKLLGKKPPNREDIYQLTAYLSHFGSPGIRILGMLAYPFVDVGENDSPVEAGNPWRTNMHSEMMFVRVPHELVMAADKLTDQIGEFD